MTDTPRRKVKRNLKNLLVSVPGTDPEDVSSGYRDDVQTFLDSYGETVLGDGQDPDAYQEYRELDLEGKWDFVKEYENKSEEELTNDFWKWKYDEDLAWDEDSMSDEFYNLMELEDEEPDDTDADSINIADFADEIKKSGGDVNKIVDRIIDLSETTDMSSDDISYVRDVLTQKVKDYLSKKENTDVSSIAKNIAAQDLGRSL